MEPAKPEINFEETWTALTAWANENLAEGGIGVAAADLGADEDDQDFIRQARFLLHYSTAFGHVAVSCYH